MSLTNTQYNTIMRVYEQKQTRNRHVREDRLNFVYSNVKGYRLLDESVATLSVSQGKKMLNGDPNALIELKKQLHQLSRDKKELLRQAGLPDDYLEPVYDCPDCHDTGYVDGKKCHCFRQAEIALLYQQSNLKEILAKENFDTLSYEYFEGDTLSDFSAIVQKCRDFAASFGSNGRNLFFYGTVGTGKTFLSNCIAREVIESGHSVIYFSASMLFDTLSRNAFDIKRQDNLDYLYNDLYNCDLLVIDDLGTEQSTPFSLSHLFTVLNERIKRGKGMIISTNLSLSELKERYQDRIFSRITSSFDFCKLTGPDIRMYRKRLANRK
ncbi:MAG TPA: ATP-binding protein [Candidatus Eisenbergiella merdavium]|uniref:ATP-binding protein n=1 Tax=Candidatus Eisenbergiella merdavium TaxID=2838551 RepID=A0A9D2SPX6_9FIRM|nr:ATP-binding protein [Candidatus Eisenbergiella merdavium]